MERDTLIVVLAALTAVCVALTCWAFVAWGPELAAVGVLFGAPLPMLIVFVALRARYNREHGLE